MMKLKLPGDITGGVYMFAIMFTIAVAQIYIFKNVKAFGACACANGHCVGDCGGGKGGGRACACTNGHCVGDCDGRGRGGGGGSRGGGKGKGGKGKSRSRGGKDDEGGDGGDGGGTTKKSTPKPKSAAPAPAPTPAPTTEFASDSSCDCTCMPMDSDPSRFKIETADGEDCYNNVYLDSMEECVQALVGVCAERGGGGTEQASLAFVPRVARISRIIIS